MRNRVQPDFQISSSRIWVMVLLVALGCLLVFVALRAKRPSRLHRELETVVSPDATRINPPISLPEEERPLAPRIEVSERVSDLPSLSPVRKAARRYVAARFNIQESQAEALSALQKDPVRAIDGIRTELFRMTELRRMQPGTEVALSQPTEITDRMALIDTLGGLHRGTQDPVLQRNVRSVLEEMISRSFEPGLGLHQKRLVLAEKFDCMALLARLDPQQAHGLLGSLQPGPMKSTLERAWALGLSDAGINPATYKDRLARF